MKTNILNNNKTLPYEKILSKIKKIDKKHLIKISIIFTLLTSLSFCVISNLGLTFAYATADELKSLKLKNPNLFNKLKDALSFYSDSIDILDVKNNIDLFLIIIREYLNNVEIYQVVEALKGMKLDEVIKLISTM